MEKLQHARGPLSGGGWGRSQSAAGSNGGCRRQRVCPKNFPSRSSVEEKRRVSAGASRLSLHTGRRLISCHWQRAPAVPLPLPLPLAHAIAACNPPAPHRVSPPSLHPPAALSALPPPLPPRGYLRTATSISIHTQPVQVTYCPPAMLAGLLASALSLPPSHAHASSPPSPAHMEPITRRSSFPTSSSTPPTCLVAGNCRSLYQSC